MFFFFLWSFIPFSVLVSVPQMSIDGAAFTLPSSSDAASWGCKTLVSCLDFLSIEVETTLEAKNSCLLLAFLFWVEGLSFFLALEAGIFSLSLVSRENAKLLPTLREKLTLLPWLASVRQKFRHWDAREVFESLTRLDQTFWKIWKSFIAFTNLLQICRQHVSSSLIV